MGKQKTQAEFEKEVEALTGSDYSVEGEYINSQTKIRIRHNTCSRTYPVRPASFLQGSRCPFCAKHGVKKGTLRKTDAQFRQEVKDLVGDEYMVEETYPGSLISLTMRHNICGRTFSVRPNNFLYGSRCPYCARKGRKKKGK